MRSLHLALRSLLPLVALVAAGAPACSGAPDAPPASASSSDQDALLPPSLARAGARRLDVSMPNQGGPVLTYVRIIDINWGANVNPVVRSVMPHFYDDYLHDVSFSLLGEYSVGGGEYDGTFTIYPSHGGTTVTSSDVKSELDDQLDAGTIPRDDPNKPTKLYVVHLPPGVTAVNGNGKVSCQGACAWHTESSSSSSGRYPIVIVPDIASVPGCACNFTNTNWLNDYTKILSHEIIEAATDPFPTTHPAYKDPNGGASDEIGDLCDPYVGNVDGNSGAGWYVSLPYLNSKGACQSTQIAPPRPPAPASGGGATAGYGGALDVLSINDRNVLEWAHDPSSWSGSFVDPAAGRLPARGDVALTSRAPGTLDGFFVDQSGGLYTTAWTGAGWSLQMLGAGVAGAKPKVSAIARASWMLDAVYADINGHLQDAWWAGDGWNTSPLEAGLPTSAGGGVAVVSPLPNVVSAYYVDVFAQLAATTGPGLGAPFASHVLDGPSLDVGADVAAVAREGAPVDVFVVGKDGSLAHVSDQSAATYDYVASGFAPSGAPLAAVTRSATTSDVFAVGPDGVVRDASCDYSSGFSCSVATISGAIFPSGETISAVQRSGIEIDVFARDNGGQMRDLQFLGGAPASGPWSMAAVPPYPPGTPTHCTGTLHCRSSVTFSCDPSPALLVMQSRDALDPNAPWVSGGHVDIGGGTVYEYRVCAEGAGGETCTDPIPFGPPAYDTGCVPPPPSPVPPSPPTTRCQEGCVRRNGKCLCL